MRPEAKIELVRAYLNVAATEDGALVLQDIMSFCGWEKSKFPAVKQGEQIDPLQLARNAGKHDVALRVHLLLNEDISAIHETIVKRREQTDE